MKTTSTKVRLTTILFFILILDPIKLIAQERNELPGTISIISANATYLTTVTDTSHGSGGPDIGLRVLTIFVNDLYELVLKIKLNGEDFYYVKPLKVRLVFNDGYQKIEYINVEEHKLDNHRFHDFYLSLKLNRKGWARLFLESCDEPDDTPGEKPIIFNETSVYFE